MMNLAEIPLNSELEKEFMSTGVKSCFSCLWHVIHLDEMGDGRVLNDGCSCSYHWLHPECMELTHDEGDYGDCPIWEER